MSRSLIIDGRRAVLDSPGVLLPDGDVGWYQRSQTDCLRAAVATATQVPYEVLPDFQTDAELLAWATDQGWRLDRHEQPPTSARRWIGMSPGYATHGGARHTLVMARERLYFDPGSGWVFDGGLRGEPARALEYGLTLERSC